MNYSTRIARFASCLEQLRRAPLPEDWAKSHSCQAHNYHMHHEGLKHSPFWTSGECVGVIGKCWDYAERMFRIWEDSPRHREILLAPQAESFGLAFYDSGNLTYATFRI